MSDPCIRRGNQWLNSDELQAHLAAIIRLENVGVLLGSGASVGALGGKTMAQLWTHFLNTYPESAEWLQHESFINGVDKVNVEELTDSLEITRLEWKRTRRPNKLRDLEKVRADVQRSVIHASLLQRQLWESPTMVDTTTHELQNHRKLVQKLISARQPGQTSPWMFTTNYDLAIEWAAESVGLKITNGFDGLHRRGFSPHNFDLGYRNTLARGEARFGTYSIYLAKLHGSLSWRTTSDGNAEECSTGLLWPEIESFLDGRTHQGPSQLVYPSAAKYLQTVGFVLGELFRRFTEFLSRPQSSLITSGYSFSDEHLNRILLTALQNPTLQLVVYIPEVTRTGNALDTTSCSSWLKRIVSLESPQVTIVGGGGDAYFDRMVEHLPDPAIYDEQAMEIREMIRRLRTGAAADDGRGAE